MLRRNLLMRGLNSFGQGNSGYAKGPIRAVTRSPNRWRRGGNLQPVFSLTFRTTVLELKPRDRRAHERMALSRERLGL